MEIINLYCLNLIVRSVWFKSCISSNSTSNTRPLRRPKHNFTQTKERAGTKDSCVPALCTQWRIMDRRKRMFTEWPCHWITSKIQKWVGQYSLTPHLTQFRAFQGIRENWRDYFLDIERNIKKSMLMTHNFFSPFIPQTFRQTSHTFRMLSHRSLPGWLLISYLSIPLKPSFF